MEPQSIQEDAVCSEGACGCRRACGSDGKLSGTDNATEATSVQEPSDSFFQCAMALRRGNGGGGRKLNTNGFGGQTWCLQPLLGGAFDMFFTNAEVGVDPLRGSTPAGVDPLRGVDR